MNPSFAAGIFTHDRSPKTSRYGATVLHTGVGRAKRIRDPLHIFFTVGVVIS
jgi:hypothetical protein